ncbi:hypothetical protein FQR65_LT12640 [Abscondita terminalis]|nr:hypothetical protein FQR65_LT12640 [Abscondita terminalis]
MKGFKKDLEVQDLYETYSSHKSSFLGNKIEKLWLEELASSKTNNKKPSLLKVLFKCFGFDYICCGISFLCIEIFVKTFQILALGELVSFYMNLTEESNKNDAYIYAAKIILCALCVVVFLHPTSMGCYHLGIKIRIACCSLIYRKAIKLNNTAFEATTSGQMVNLISNDLKNFERFSQISLFLWIAPLQTIILGYFMYKEAGYSSIFGVFFILAFIPLHFYMGKIVSVYRAKSAARTDERIRLMNEIITGISVIKMYTWEKPFIKLLLLCRKLEMKAIRVTAYIKSIYSACISLNSRIPLFLTILSYVIIHNQINAQQVFVLTGLYNLLRQTMLIFFPAAVTLTAEIKVCLKRITDFLLLEEACHTVSKKYDLQENAVTLKNVSARWSKKSQHALRQINVNIAAGKVTAIIGPVGSGKSSLLNVILKEVTVTEGDVFVNGRASYASQEPWLFHESVQQNILFGSNLNYQLYQEVVKSCALLPDFRRLPYSDSTIVSEKGASLSGGQRARINLARAVYKDADIYLLDDPLSAVDAQVGKEIFDNCLLSHLKKKTVVLVTHQLQYLTNVDHIIVMDRGCIIAQGSFIELQKSGVDFAKYLRQDLVDDDEHTFTERERRESVNSQVVLIENKQKPLPETPEKKIKGSVSGSVYKKYIRSGGNWLMIGTITTSFFTMQALLSGSDYFLTYWVNAEQKEQQSRSEESDRLRKVYLYTYCGFIIATIIMSVVHVTIYTETCIKASINLHNKTFLNVIRATLRFFLSNPSGRILNRFSKDMGAVDELLPYSIMETATIALMVLGIVAITSIVNAWLILPVVVIGIVFYYLRIIYIGTSRSVKRLEGVTKSPMIEHLNASLRGLATIRAAGAQNLLIEEFDNHQDLNSCATYLFWATSKAFGYWLDIFCVGYVAVVTLSSLLSQSEKLGGNVGLIISQALMLTGVFQWGIRQVSELENQMTSVERISDYDTIEVENLNDQSKSIVNRSWPKSGKIQFVNLSLSYLLDAAPVLKNVSFEIMPLQKVGIVGRTGAGKSSLINALFRLVDVDGTIFIDDIDIKNVSLQQLRSKISIIPQEPVLFSGSLRNNLDPFQEYTDDILWDALEKVELKDTIAHKISGLDSEISEGGSNLSVGQRQLLCLARALLRKNKILVLDEATANVDHVTDALIQSTIRKQFNSCTVVVIAHRLDTVIDCDKILVMDAGQAVEFDNPHVLLQNVKGVFYRMVKDTGKSKLQTLIQTAKTKYDTMMSPPVES